MAANLRNCGFNCEDLLTGRDSAILNLLQHFLSNNFYSISESTMFRSALLVLSALLGYRLTNSSWSNTHKLPTIILHFLKAPLSPHWPIARRSVTTGRRSITTEDFHGRRAAVFRTTDNGATWAPITDGKVPLGSIGSIAVADSDPNIYAGTGSDGVRSNVSTDGFNYTAADKFVFTTLGRSARCDSSDKPDIVWVAAVATFQVEL
jgi:hypothetical protein